MPEVRVVWLNGLLHTDDRSVIEKIILELECSSLEDIEDDGFVDMGAGSMAARFNRTFQVLRETKHSKPIVFVLEEFDLFAAHSRQALLYNLFDIVQHCRNSFAVVGITSRHDYIDLLEKRVKSRFSHRQISFYPCESFKEYTSLAKELLHVDSDSNLSDQSRKRVNSLIAIFLEDDDMKQMLESSFDMSKSMAHLIFILKVIIDKFGPSWDELMPCIDEDFIYEDSACNQCRGIIYSASVFC